MDNTFGESMRKDFCRIGQSKAQERLLINEPTKTIISGLRERAKEGYSSFSYYGNLSRDEQLMLVQEGLNVYRVSNGVNNYWEISFDLNIVK